MLGVTLGSLYVDTSVYVLALVKNLCGMSCSGAYWLLGGGWFWCRYGGFWMISYYLMFHVVRTFLVFSGFGLKCPASGFPIVSRLLQLYSDDNKTSRLKVNRFFTMSDNQRGSQSYMKNRRGRKEIEVSTRRERGTQEERDRSTQLSVPKVFSIAQRKGGNRGVPR